MTHSAPDVAAITQECEAFTRHLTDAAPTAYVLDCYARLVASAALPDGAASQLIERALLAAGRSGGLVLRLADAYACLFRPRAELRRRLILIVAILENTPEFAHLFNSGEVGSFVRVSARMIVAVATSVLSTLAGVLAFAPVHVVSALRRTPERA